MHTALLAQEMADSTIANRIGHSKKDIFHGGVVAGVALFVITMAWILSRSAGGRVVQAAMAICCGGLYIVVSAMMIETNKWLMQEDHFPYPVMLTTNHMLASCILANSLRLVHPTSFPSLSSLTVTREFHLKLMGIGIPFAISLMCGNWAYKYLSVSFLQIMKQTNICTIYFLSVLAGLEVLRRCSLTLLAGVMVGAMMAVQGEMHFVLVGFLLQACSSVCEAAKVIIQSVLMSGETKLDPLTMVLFMAPACFVANLIPLALLEGHHMAAIHTQFIELWPIILGNACLAFVLNVTVAQCIKQLSAVGYLLCGIVKDICIIVTSTWFMGESLAQLQMVGFSIALSFVVLYSLYKQNISMFDDDNLLKGFTQLFFGRPAKLLDTPKEGQDALANKEEPAINHNTAK